MTMMLTTYLASLSPLALLRSLPGACAKDSSGVLSLHLSLHYPQIVGFLPIWPLTVPWRPEVQSPLCWSAQAWTHGLLLSLLFLAGITAGFITGMLQIPRRIQESLQGILTQISLLLYQLKYSRKLQSGSQRWQIQPQLCLVFRTQLQAKSRSVYDLYSSSRALYSLPFPSTGISEQSRTCNLQPGCNRQMARAQGINYWFSYRTLHWWSLTVL